MGRTCAVLLVLAATLLTAKAASDTCSSSGKAQSALLDAFDGPLTTRLKNFSTNAFAELAFNPETFLPKNSKGSRG